MEIEEKFGLNQKKLHLDNRNKETTPISLAYGLQTFFRTGPCSLAAECFATA